MHVILLIYLDESPFDGQFNLHQNERTTSLLPLCQAYKKSTYVEYSKYKVIYLK